MRKQKSKVVYGRDKEDIEEMKQYLCKCINLARERKDNSLIRCIQRLRRWDRSEDVELRLYKDWAPFSLEFSMFNNKYQQREINGGIIFHGRHDGFGSGSAPTFSVCLTPTDGWSTHT